MIDKFYIQEYFYAKVRNYLKRMARYMFRNVGQYLAYETKGRKQNYKSEKFLNLTWGSRFCPSKHAVRDIE